MPGVPANTNEPHSLSRPAVPEGSAFDEALAEEGSFGLNIPLTMTVVPVGSQDNWLGVDLRTRTKHIWSFVSLGSYFSGR